MHPRRTLALLALLCPSLLSCDIAEPESDRLEGSFSGPLVETWSYTSGGAERNVVVTYQVQGGVVLVRPKEAGSTPGVVFVDYTTTVMGRTGDGCQCEGGNGGRQSFRGALTGTRSSFAFADTLMGQGAIRVDPYVEVVGGGTEEEATVTIKTGWLTVVTTGTRLTGGPGSWTVTLR
jgi:hypothetical protein